MSLLTKGGRISVKPFAKVPALLDLPVIERAHPSISNVSSRPGTAGGVDLSEGCIVTKAVKYTHQLAHWVNAVRGDRGDAAFMEELIKDEMCIVDDPDFTLNDPCNLAYLEAFVHTSLDLYAFIAVTASSSTLDELLEMVELDNTRRQKEMDASGKHPRRMLNFSLSCVANPEYELVALHPEHFLPGSAVLTVYGPGPNDRKDYVAAEERCLRETRDHHSPRLPPFHHSSQSPERADPINIFLVIINAEVKFRRYFEMIKQNPPSMPLPDDVFDLVRRTIKLVDLLYWRPVPTKGSKGATRLARRQDNRRQNDPRPARPQGPILESDDDTEMGGADDAGVLTPPDRSSRAKHRKELEWFRNADLETRKAFMTDLIIGHDRDYDPSLFEDAFPLDDIHLYSEPTAMESWQQGVSIYDPSDAPLEI